MMISFEKFLNTDVKEMAKLVSLSNGMAFASVATDDMDKHFLMHMVESGMHVYLLPDMQKAGYLNMENNSAQMSKGALLSEVSDGTFLAIYDKIAIAAQELRKPASEWKEFENADYPPEVAAETVLRYLDPEQPVVDGTIYVSPEHKDELLLRIGTEYFHIIKYQSSADIQRIDVQRDCDSAPILSVAYFSPEQAMSKAANNAMVSTATIRRILDIFQEAR